MVAAFGVQEGKEYLFGLMVYSGRA